jgi:hypothetical protein
MTYQPMRRLMPLAILLSLVLSRGALAQTNPVVIAAAKTTDLAVNVFADAADGTVTLDTERQKTLQEQYTGTDWSIFDNGVVAISKNNQTVEVANSLSTTDKTFYFFHFRDKDHVVNGTIIRSTTDKTQGVANLFITTFAADGSSTTAYIQFVLTFTQ